MVSGLFGFGMACHTVNFRSLSLAFLTSISSVFLRAVQGGTAARFPVVLRTTEVVSVTCRDLREGSAGALPTVSLQLNATCHRVAVSTSALHAVIGSHVRSQLLLPHPSLTYGSSVVSASESSPRVGIGSMTTLSVVIYLTQRIAVAVGVPTTSGWADEKSFLTSA
jgi:hypothetical protein